MPKAKQKNLKGEDVVDFPEAQEKSDSTKLSEIDGKTLLISGFDIKDGSMGPYAEIYTDIGNVVSSSEVVLDQLNKRVQTALDEGKKVRCQVKIGKYHSLIAPGK